MKKLIIFLVLAAAGYFVYTNFIAKKEIVQVEGNLVRVQESASLEAPGVSARNFGHAEGTVKNLSENVVKNVAINYMIDRQKSYTIIPQINPGAEVKFSTNRVLIRVLEPPFYLESVTFQ